MKIERLILYILLIMCLYNFFVQNYSSHFTLKADLTQIKMSIKCSVQIEYDSIPCVTIQIDHSK